MPRHLERRRRRWYAVLDIPANAKKHFGGQTRLRKSLETESLTEAEVRVLHVIAEWKAQFEEARTGKPTRLRMDMTQVMEWRQDFQRAAGEEQDILEDVVSERAEDLAWDSPDEARTFQDIVTGKTYPTDHLLEDWLSRLTDEPKTVDDKRNAVLRFAKAFPLTHEVTRQKVRVWANSLLSGDEGTGGKARKVTSPTTVRKIASHLRRYWSFLQDKGVVTSEVDPFKEVMPQKRKKTKVESQDARTAFTEEELARLLSAAAAKKDHHLTALMWLGMWTGARIEELCSLRVENVKDDRIRITNAKTPAGNREVPIHSRLKPMVRTLMERSHDGFLLSGLTLNKYGDRSNAIGKRFGRLKTDLRFGPDKVFHSIRRTVVTELENAGVDLWVREELLGHERTNFQSRAYSQGARFSVRQEAIEKLHYNIEAPSFC